MSSADHILNPLCPVFQVSNFLPEHRTLKQAVKKIRFNVIFFQTDSREHNMLDSY